MRNSEKEIKKKQNEATITTPEKPTPDPGRQAKIPVKKDDDNDFTTPENPSNNPETKKPTSFDESNPESEVNQGGNDTSRNDPDRINPSTSKNAALGGNISKGSFLIILFLTLLMPPKTEAKDQRINSIKENTEASVQAHALLTRLDEINNMDKTNMAPAEKRVLRKEVKGIKQQLSVIGGGVYLSVGAIIIIILLLILLI